MTLTYVASGFAVGLLVGLTGVGGGSLMTPLLTLLFGINPTVAVGTDLAFASVTKSAGTLTHRVAGEAYEAAGIGPEDIDVVQCHAPFAGGGFVCAEALGVCEEGEGGRFFLEGRAALDGDVAFNTDGGLLARGHPLGATGLAEIHELVRQLRGEAGELQMPRRPKIAVAHNTGLGCLNMHVLGR